MRGPEGALLLFGRALVAVKPEGFLNPTSSFLQGRSPDQITDDALLSAIVLEGVVTVGGQMGRFRTALFPISVGVLHPPDPIREIVFAPRP
jgi:hypothetical protein